MLLRRVLITGASSGVGEALAMQLSQAGGVGLHLTGRNAGNLQSVADRCRADGASMVSTSVCDVASEDDVQSMWDEYRQAHGDEIDVVVANAGVNRIGDLETCTLSDYHTVIDTNVLGVFLTLRATLPTMKRQRSGQIVVTNSVRGFVGGAGSSLYCASKFAVRGMMKSVRKEVSPFGIKVGSVFPGGIDTAWWQDASRGGRQPGTTDTSTMFDADDVALEMMDIIEQGPESNIEEIEMKWTSPGELSGG
jgi:3-oxoacyl-[acyl-carrier protein] reductase